MIRRLQPELAKVEGITLYMQPVQDLTVEDRVSRTQYQYSLEDADAQELALWAPQLVEKLKRCPNCATSPAISRTVACRPNWSSIATPRRGSALLPQAIDDTLYDAFGQRQVSTIFTQLNQYHVVLEVEPEFQQDPGRSENVLCANPPNGTQVPLSRLRALREHAIRLAINHQGQFPGGHALVQSGAGSFARRSRPRQSNR